MKKKIPALEFFLSRLALVGVSATLIFLPTHPDRFRDQAHLMLLIIWIGWVLWVLSQTRAWIVGPFLAFAGYSAMSVFSAKTSPYGTFATLTDGPASSALLLLCLVVTALIVTPERVRMRVYQVLEITALMSSVLLIFKMPGALDNRGLDASFIACVYPAICFRRDLFRPGRNGAVAGLISIYWDFAKLVLPLIAIFVSYSATGVFALMAATLATLWMIGGRKWILVALAGSGVIGLLGYAVQGHDLVSSNGRTEIWPLFWEWWKAYGHYATGTGLGTFQILGQSIQKDHGWKAVLFLYAHNEWIQIGFELGVIGLILSGAVYLSALKKSFQRRAWQFSSLCAMGVVSLSQSPLRISLLAFWAGLIVRDSLLLEKDEDM